VCPLWVLCIIPPGPVQRKLAWEPENQKPPGGGFWQD
jgi:hypothetical protein